MKPLVTIKKLNYSPRQPRDKGGKWTSGGSSYNPYDNLDIKSLGITAVESGDKAYGIENKEPIFDKRRMSYILLDKTVPTEVYAPKDTKSLSKKQSKKNIENLTAEEKTSITGYTSEYGYGSYKEVNKYLRGNSNVSQETKIHAENITSALNKSKLGTSTYVFRGAEADMFEDESIQRAIKFANKVKDNGVGKQKLENLEALNSLKGKIIQDKAPLSTSLYGGNFLTHRDVKITIKTKPNDKAMNITDLSKYGGASDVPAFIGVALPESEVLYAPNTSFEIKDVKLTSYGVNILMETTDNKSNNSLDVIINYSPSQPRGKDGKWSGGGSISSKHSNYTPNEYEEFVKKEYGSMTTFSNDEKSEIGDYVDMGYTYTNADLVEGKPLDDYRKITVKTLDKSMRHKLKEDTPLYRGLILRDGAQVGDVIKYKGYSSSSINKDSAKKFMEETLDSNEKFLMKINAQKGQKGIFTYLAADKSYDKSLATQEQEFLLPRNLGMKVEKIIQKDGYKELEMSIL